MTTQYYVGPRYGQGARFVGFVLAAVLGVAACVVFVRYATKGVLGRMATLITGRATTFDTSVPAVVEKIRRLNRLETVEYSIDTVVEGDRSTPLLPDALAGDRLLLVVHGQSIAGIDLSMLKPEDVSIDPGTRSIHVALPASEIFVTSLDNQHTRVFSAGNGAAGAGGPGPGDGDAGEGAGPVAAVGAGGRNPGCGTQECEGHGDNAALFVGISESGCDLIEG